MEANTKNKVKMNGKTGSLPSRSSSAYFIWIAKNILAVAVVALILKEAIQSQPGYNWVYNGLLKGNMETIKAYPHLNFDEKMGMKLGASYSYLMYVKEQTPENAVILWPSGADFMKEKSPFSGELGNKTYALRFLYPRKLVTPDERGKSRYEKEITHVAIVNGAGLDNLPYPVGQPFEHGVLPVKPQNR